MVITVDQPLMHFKSHIEGKNADVDIYADRVEWARPRGVSGAKLTTGVLTVGLSLLGTGVRSSKAGSEVIPVKAISSVTTKRDGMKFTNVRIICSGNTINFRLTHGDAHTVKALLTDLVLGKHPAQQSAVQAAAQSTPSSPTGGPSVADELAKLAGLRTAGVLTDEEFNEQKRRILGL